MSHREPSCQRLEVCVEFETRATAAPMAPAPRGRQPPTSATSVSLPKVLPSSVASEQPGQNQTSCPLRVAFFYYNKRCKQWHLLLSSPPSPSLPTVYWEFVMYQALF